MKVSALLNSGALILAVSLSVYALNQANVRSAPIANLPSESGGKTDTESSVPAHLGNISDQLRSIQVEHAQVIEKLSGKVDLITKRMSDIEARANTTSPVDSSFQDHKSNGDVELTENGFADWLEKSMEINAGDAEMAKATSNQVASAVSVKLPGVNLDGLHCGEGYCRAILSHASGGKVEATKLFGEPPFMGQGFTVEDPDGRTLLYFTDAGKDLSELKSEADVAVQMGMIER